MTPSRPSALDVSSTVRNSTNAKRFSALKYVLSTGSPG
jgi:hypothetical protein